MILGGDGEDGVLNIFIFVHFRLIEGFVEVRRIVILISDANTNKLGHWNRKKNHKLKFTILKKLSI